MVTFSCFRCKLFTAHFDLAIYLNAFKINTLNDKTPHHCLFVWVAGLKNQISSEVRPRFPFCLLAPHCETKLLHLRPSQFNPALSCQGSIRFVWRNFYGTRLSLGTHGMTWGTERFPLPALHHAIFIANSSLEACLLLIKS